MNVQTEQFTTEIIDKWESLNALLGEQFAHDPNDVLLIRHAGRLAGSIRQFAETAGLDSKDAVVESPDLAVICEAADSKQAGLFASASKKNILSIAAHYEADGNGKYKFLRNVITVESRSAGKRDLLDAARLAAQFLVRRLSIDINWKPEISVSKALFHTEVVLQIGPNAKDNRTAVNIQFVKRGPNGAFEPYNPSRWDFNLKPAD